MKIQRTDTNKITRTRCTERIVIPFLFLLLVMIFPGCASTKALDRAPQPGTSRGNLHMHTTCSDGRNSYEEMVQEALRLKMSFIAITDHTFGGSPICDDVIGQCKNEQRLLCIPGMEVTGKVHLLAIGIGRSVDKWLPLKEQVEEIHRQGGLAIAAHPFRARSPYSEDQLFKTGIDAVECKGIPAGQEEAFYARLKEHSIPCVYNSDAHSKGGLKKEWNTCQGEIRSFDDLKAAIRKGRCAYLQSPH